MSRGISTIIAAILLLIITIGLAGTAYLFITRIINTQTNKVIQVLSADCTNNNITLVISNQGTDTIASADMTILINNVDKTSEFPDLTPLDPQDTKVDTYDPGATPYSDSVTIVVTSPSNSQTLTIWC